MNKYRKIYDMLGNEVKKLVNKYRETGKYDIEFKSSVSSLHTGQADIQLASAIYFHRLQSGAFIRLRR